MQVAGGGWVFSVLFACVGNSLVGVGGVKCFGLWMAHGGCWGLKSVFEVRMACEDGVIVGWWCICGV